MPHEYEDDELRLFDEALSVAHPNPTREGCPSQEVLEELARRTRPIDDPGYRHLLTCSPCHREVRAIQLAPPTEWRARASRGWWRWPAAAGVVVALGLGVWMGRAPSGPLRSRATTESRQIELDLRERSAIRSLSPEPRVPPLELPQALVRVTILLPMGSPPGTYDVRVVEEDLEPLASARGEAEIRAFITVLDATVDLREAMPGSHFLAVRYETDEWRLFPVVVP